MEHSRTNLVFPFAPEDAVREKGRVWCGRELENWKRGGVWCRVSSTRRKIYLSPRKQNVKKNTKQETKKKIGEKDSGKKKKDT